MEDGPLYFKDKKNNKKLKASQCNFDQAKMREHLYKCFSGRKLLPFPENIATLIKNNKKLKASQCNFDQAKMREH